MLTVKLFYKICCSIDVTIFEFELLNLGNY